MALLVNTTFFVEDSVSLQLLEWLRSDYLAAIKSSGLFSDVLLCEITPQREPGVTSYAVQGVCETDADADVWTEGESARLLCDMTAMMGSKALYFTTSMRVLDR